MGEHADRQHGAVGGHHLPAVGVVVPAFVGVADRDLEAEAARRGRHVGCDDIRLPRDGAARGKHDGEDSGGETHQALNREGAR